MAGRKYFCGVDIGTENMAFCFYSCDRIIGYRGSCSKILRYEENEPVTEIKIDNESNHASLVKIIQMIPEFENTIVIRIEKQVALHNHEVLRLDGIVFGAVSVKCPNADVQYTNPSSRMSFVRRILEEKPECLLAKLPKKKYRDAKIPSLQITSTFFSSFYRYLLSNVDDDKLDDICDCVIYAIHPIYESKFF